MIKIKANDLKIKGISLLEPILKKENEAVISVRGTDRYVVMDMETYHHLRDCELEAALIECQNDLEKGNVITESVQAHIKRLSHAV